MGGLGRRIVLLIHLLSGLLSACAASTIDSRAGVAPPSPISDWVDGEENRGGDAECLTLLCSESQSACALFRCEDVSPGAGGAGKVILARGGGGVMLAPPPTSSSASASRYWGSAQGLPEDRLPVFVIPWHNHDRKPLLPPGVQLAIQEHVAGPGRLVKHHIFPQEFKEWFKIKGINIHEETMLLEAHVHDRIHLGARGGPWNAAWRQFIDLNGTATKEEIWRYAGELIHRFGIDGPILPYYGRVALPCPFLTVR
ncbi:TIGR02269 family lipoprotein [Vitiosangium sp. GDMCC 1.1324]|uniref:SitA6 family polymorphic toxin lipoprotein n=1 Tax=Vitiosangium sp. (strain GDMCC 1.1324) TaxID=2138576 RepID=UPI001E2F08FD|nr:TIGR02269 family lipoprotein [Vitiosangium sp. GDMCC 1.1324]